MFKFFIFIFSIVSFTAHAAPRKPADLKEFPFVARIVQEYKTDYLDAPAEWTADARKKFQNAKSKRMSFFTSKCTGSLVKPNQILTAAHCVREFPMGQDLSTFPHITLFAEFPGDIEGQFVKAAYYLPGRVPSQDWAILELFTPVTHIKPVPLLSPTIDIGNGPITAVGYDGDLFDAGLTTRPLMRDDCNRWPSGEFYKADLIKSKYPNLYVMSCFAKPGNSGGPILALVEGEYHLVGILTMSFNTTHDSWIVDDFNKWYGVEASPFSKHITMGLPTRLLPPYVLRK